MMYSILVQYGDKHITLSVIQGYSIVIPYNINLICTFLLFFNVLI